MDMHRRSHWLIKQIGKILNLADTRRSFILLTFFYQQGSLYAHMQVTFLVPGESSFTCQCNCFCIGAHCNPISLCASSMLPRVFCSFRSQSSISLCKCKSKSFCYWQCIAINNRWGCRKFNFPCPCINIFEYDIVQHCSHQRFTWNKHPFITKGWWLRIYYNAWAFTG